MGVDAGAAGGVACQRRGAALVSRPRTASSRGGDRIEVLFMHYPHRTSRIKRVRAIGFRARMKTKNGRKLMNRKRAAGRSLNVANKR